MLQSIQKIVITLTLSLVLFTPSTIAQSQETITNEDVIKLTKANVSSKVIIEMLKTSKLKIDTTPNGIISLSSAGVHEDVITMMRTLSAATVTNTAVGAATNDGPYGEKDLALFEGENTIVLVQGNRRTVLGPTTANYSIKTKGLGLAMVTGVGLKLVAQYSVPGVTSQTKTDSLPRFHFGLDRDTVHPRPIISVVKFKTNKNKNQREVEAPDGDFLFTDIGSSSDQGSVVLTKLQTAVIGGKKGAIWELGFSKRLFPGEYAVVVKVGSQNAWVFDFSITE